MVFNLIKMWKKNRIVILFFTVLCLLISISMVLFSLEEAQREKLIRAYTLAAAETKLPSEVGVWDTALILQSNEVLACAMGSYGAESDLYELNSYQKNSIPKSKLPSQDGSWYLLFFSARQAERITLYSTTASNLVPDFVSCGDRKSQFSITTRSVGMFDSELVISFFIK